MAAIKIIGILIPIPILAWEEIPVLATIDGDGDNDGVEVLLANDEELLFNVHSRAPLLELTFEVEFNAPVAVANESTFTSLLSHKIGIPSQTALLE